jgi:uncharacterized protein YkwD
MKKRTAAIIAFAMLAALLVVSVPEVASASSPSLNCYEKQVVNLVNQERTKRGLARLRVNAKLVNAARTHSTDMGDNQYFGHDSPTGESWSARIVNHGYRRVGYRVWKAGENIFWGAGLFSSPVMAVDQWMDSPAHRQVILTKDFRDLGIGAVEHEGGFGQCCGTVWFFTLDLGRRAK